MQVKGPAYLCNLWRPRRIEINVNKLSLSLSLSLPVCLSKSKSKVCLSNILQQSSQVTFVEKN